jgi:hypothetical protein
MKLISEHSREQSREDLAVSLRNIDLLRQEGELSPGLLNVAEIATRLFHPISVAGYGLAERIKQLRSN